MEGHLPCSTPTTEFPARTGSTTAIYTAVGSQFRNDVLRRALAPAFEQEP